MFNPYGAVPRALQNMQGTIRNIGQNVASDKERIAGSQLMQAKMDYQNTALKGDLAAKTETIRQGREKIDILKNDNPMMPLGQILGVLYPDAAKLKRVTDHFTPEQLLKEFSFNKTADAVATMKEKEQSGSIDMTSPDGTRTSKVSAAGAADWRARGWTDGKKTEAKPISATSTKRIDDLGDREARRLFAEAGKFLEKGEDIYSVMSRPMADLFDKTKARTREIFNKGGVTEAEAWKKGFKSTQVELGDKLVAEMLALPQEKQDEILDKMETTSPFMYKILGEATARYQKKQAVGEGAAVKVAPDAGKKDLTEGIKEPTGPKPKTGAGRGWKPNPDDLRRDGSKKGNGWLGTLPITYPDGRTGAATEYTVGISLDGKEVDIPTLVPTLTKKEVKLMVDDIMPNHKKVPAAIMAKAVAHAKKLIGEGKSPYVGTPDSMGSKVPNVLSEGVKKGYELSKKGGSALLGKNEDPLKIGKSRLNSTRGYASK